MTRRKDVLGMLPTGFGKHNFSAVSSCCYMSLHLKSLCYLVRECHKKSLFCLVFDHERSSRTVKTTRVLGCNQRNRKRIGREQGKIAFAFLKENLLYSKMWSNNYMYSVLVKDYRCTQLHLRMLCHENYISVMSVVQHNQLSTSVLNK